MPYFIYKITQSTQKKTLEYLCEYATFKEAKQYVRNARTELPADEPASIKIIFAETQDEAEARLHETRETPILREWEK